jgi:hypothetical protein
MRLRLLATIVGVLASASPSAAAPGLVTLRHAPSGLSIQEPAGSRLTVSKGVYVLKAGATTLTFSRSANSNFIR